MNVSLWVIVLLSTLSALLVLLCVVCVGQFIRQFSRRRPSSKYKQLSNRTTLLHKANCWVWSKKKHTATLDTSFLNSTSKPKVYAATCQSAPFTIETTTPLPVICQPLQPDVVDASHPVDAFGDDKDDGETAAASTMSSLSLSPGDRTFRRRNRLRSKSDLGCRRKIMDLLHRDVSSASNSPDLSGASARHSTSFPSSFRLSPNLSRRVSAPNSMLKQLSVPDIHTSTEYSVEDLTSDKPCAADPTVYLHSDMLNEAPVIIDMVDDNPVVSYDQQEPDTTNPPTVEEPSHGALHFSLVYEATRMQLQIFVREAANLLPLGMNNSSESSKEEAGKYYVNLCMLPEDFLWQRTKLRTSPVFHERFTIADVLHHKLREYSICFFVMRKSAADEIEGDEIIGRAVYGLSDLRAGQCVETHVELF